MKELTLDSIGTDSTAWDKVLFDLQNGASVIVHPRIYVELRSIFESVGYGHRLYSCEYVEHDRMYVVFRDAFIDIAKYLSTSPLNNATIAARR